ncbi:MAG: YceI family protein, partial [Bacteroidota bacterium]
QRAAAVFEREVQRIIRASELGDAFTAIAADVPIQSWDALGLSLPEKEGSFTDVLREVPPMPTSWEAPVALGSEIPMVQFRFQAPLDRYLGEIKEVEGSVTWDEAAGTLRGNFVADMSSLTMGMASFDEVVLKDYVKVKRHPTSSFQFETPLAAQSLDYSQSINQKVSGTFELMGKKRPVEVIAKISPIIDSQGQARLLVNTSFELNVVKDFKIKGPDGPSPAREIMEFNLSFLMEGA